MLVPQLVDMLCRDASAFHVDGIEQVNRDSHLNEMMGDCGLSQKQLDAVVCAFVNYVARRRGCDLALHTKDLDTK